MRCDHCPVTPGTPCHHETTGAKWPCEMARGNESQRLHVVIRSERPAAPAARAAAPPWMADKPAAPRVPPPPPEERRENMRLTALYRRCPYRSAASCGCAGSANCAIKGGVVTARECRDCVRTYPL